MVDFPAMLVYRRISFCRGPLSITTHIYLNSTSRNLKTNLTYAFVAFLMCTIGNYTLENAAQICKRKPVYKPWTDPDIYLQVNYLNNGNTLGISFFSLQEILFTMILTSIMLHFTFSMFFFLQGQLFRFFCSSKKSQPMVNCWFGLVGGLDSWNPLIMKGIGNLGCTPRFPNHSLKKPRTTSSFANAWWTTPGPQDLLASNAPNACRCLDGTTPGSLGPLWYCARWAPTNYQV